MWTCSRGHTWSTSLASRTSGAGCPECREAGKSRVERNHHAAAVALFGEAASGRPVTTPAGRRWLVDILTSLADGTTLVIEYDGAHWHATKTDLDATKSRDLLDAGYLVARLREHPLPPLIVEDPRYTEIAVHSAAPDPKGGAVEHGPRLFRQPTCHHAPEVYSGISEAEAAEMLKAFFRERR